MSCAPQWASMDLSSPGCVPVFRAHQVALAGALAGSKGLLVNKGASCGLRNIMGGDGEGPKQVGECSAQ